MSVPTQRVHGGVPSYKPFFGLAEAGLLPTKFASSKGRHLKSFLYPPHVTLRLAHCWHAGFVSSHLSRLALQVMQPARKHRRINMLSKHGCGERHETLRRQRSITAPYQNQDKAINGCRSVPLRLFDCLRFVRPFGWAGLLAEGCDGGCWRF